MNGEATNKLLVLVKLSYRQTIVSVKTVLTQAYSWSVFHSSGCFSFLWYYDLMFCLTVTFLKHML